MGASTAAVWPAATATKSLGTALERARCRRPALIERMKRSLSTHGQLTPLAAVERAGKVEVLDGFKRLAAARELGWEELSVSTLTLDETTLWATMLALNWGPRSMTELEEALVLRELARAGLTQVAMAELVQRHQSWVSRRIGLVERLHPELVEGMRLGVLHPGVARRLLPLPPGNQLEVAAAAQSSRLMPRDIERLVGLWQQATDPQVRRFLLAQPRTALAHAFPETKTEPGDVRLTPQGQKLLRLLRLLQGVMPRALSLLSPPPPKEDLALLSDDLRSTAEPTSRLATALGRIRSDVDGGASDAPDATS